MGNFIPNKSIRNNVENKNIGGLRRSLVSIILSDRSFASKDFENSLKYIENSGIDIYESFDNGELFSLKNNPTEDDFGEAVYGLKANFNKKRIEDVKKLSRMLYGNKLHSAGTNALGSEGSSLRKKTQSHQKMKKKGKHKGFIVAGVVAVAAAVIIGIAINTINQ